MGDSLDNPALQLFHLELQELMEQVGLALKALVDSATAADVKRLCRSMRLIHQGAVQMQLQAMEERTSEFLKILLPVSNVPESDLSDTQLETLTRLYRELQTVELVSLDAVSLNDSVPEFDLNDNAAAVTPDLSAGRESDAAASFSELGASATSSFGVSSDLRQVLLQHDIAEVIAQLEYSVQHLTGALLVTDATPKLNALVGWGEVLNWLEFVTLARAIALGIESHPDAALTIASVGLMGLQALHQSALKSAPMMDRGDDLTSVGGTTAHPVSFGFGTAQKFIWQLQRAIFVLDSTAIAETLIPQQRQVIAVEHQSFLQWRGQRVPMVNPAELLMQQWAPDLGRAPVSRDLPTSSPGPVIVLETAQGTMALEIEMEQFIRTPTLEVTPVVPTPRFLLGCTPIQGHTFQLIDVLELLALSPQPMAFQPQTEPSLVSVPTDVQPSESLPAQLTVVLVVDDSRIIRYLLQRTFENSRFSVILAEDGLEAIQKLQQYPDIALMVSDVEMPNLNGFELLSRCRRQTEWKDLPIIILSQCSTNQHQQLALQFGANAYLNKPFDDATFLATVESVLVA